MTKNKWIRLAALLLVVMICLPVVPASGSELDRIAVERQVYAYLTGKMGLNSAAACGIMANIEKESGFTLTAVGDSGSSFGLCQWHESRYEALMTFCAAQGLDYESVMGQLEYLHYELRNFYPSLYARLRQVDDDGYGAYEAGYLWCVEFERPADMEEKGVERGNTAQYKYWVRYHGAELPQSGELGSFTRELLRNSGVRVNPGIEEWSLEAQPEKETEAQSGGKTGVARRIRFKAYVPKHRPPAELPCSVAVGVSVGFQFVTLGDGRKLRKFRLPIPDAREIPEPAV